MMIVTPWDTTINTVRASTSGVKSSCHPLGLKILIQTITKIPERVKTR